MSETNAPEPTMEEILASIRRIISEDDAAAPAAAEAAASPGDPPQPPTPHAESKASPHPDDVLELTDRVEPEPPKGAEPFPPPSAAPPPAAPSASLGDLDFAPPPSASAPPSSAPRPRPPSAPTVAVPPNASDEPLVGAGTAGRAAEHFGALASSMALPAPGRTLEDVTRELLRPLLKEWLDQNLATIVEARVQDEVERISRRRTY